MMKASIYKMFGSLLLLSFASCTQVELLSVDEIKSQENNFSVNYDWSLVPDIKNVASESEVYLVRTRILNTLHKCDSTNLDGEFLLTTVPIFTSQKSITVPTGEYVMTAFTKPSTSDKVQILKLEEFKVDKMVGINQLAMRNVNAKASELVKDRSWEDLNPGYGYVFAPEEELYVSRCDYLNLDARKSIVQTFKFEPLLQQVEVTFAIEFIKEENGEIIDVIPDDIYAELSGVIPQVSLSTGLLNTSESKKMIVNAKEERRESTEDGVTVYYRASYKCFGLIAGLDRTTISGPGIFRLGIYLKHNGLKRTVRVVSNLSEKIDQQNLTELTGKVNERKKTKDKATVAIDMHVIIRVSVMNENSNDGISGWEIDKSNNVDAEA